MGGGGFTGDRGNDAGREPGRRLPDPDLVVIPDDISELDPEVRAYHHELSRRRWSERLGSGWYGLSAPAIVMTLVLIALMSGLAMLLTPIPGDQPQPRPLAEPSAEPGTVGALLPDITVMLYQDRVPLRTRRPAVIALPSPDCGCAAALDAIYLKARTHRIQFDIVGAPARIAELRALDQRTGNGGALVFTDPGGTLAATYPSSRLTMLVVGVDGIVLAILNDPQPTTSIGPLLAQAAGDV